MLKLIFLQFRYPSIISEVIIYHACNVIHFILGDRILYFTEKPQQKRLQTCTQRDEVPLFRNLLASDQE